ncbi:hypothetical protein BH18ACI2_BH18ACI2_11570 [soil metagenome]
MRTIINATNKLVHLVAAVTLAATLAAAQQPPPSAAKLQTESLERLATKASQVVDVNIDERVLRLVPIKMLMESSDKDEQIAAQLLKELKGVYVRSYEFNAPGEYGESDVSGVRTQLRSPGWTRIVNVIQKKDGRTVEVHLLSDGAKIGGLAVVAFEPRRLTLVNIVGNIDVEKLSRLEGRFGIPELNIGRDRDDEDEPETKPAKKP